MQSNMMRCCEFSFYVRIKSLTLTSSLHYYYDFCIEQQHVSDFVMIKIGAQSNEVGESVESRLTETTQLFLKEFAATEFFNRWNFMNS